MKLLLTKLLLMKLLFMKLLFMKLLFMKLLFMKLLFMKLLFMKLALEVSHVVQVWAWPSRTCVGACTKILDSTDSVAHTTATLARSSTLSISRRDSM